MIKFLIWFALFFVPIRPASASVSKQQDRFALGLAIETLGYTIQVRPIDESVDRKAVYKPNLRGAVGLTLSAFGLSASYLVQADQAAEEESKKGKTSYDDIRLSTFLGKNNQWRISGYYTRYKGFYIDNSSEVDASVTPSDPLIQKNNLELQSFGFSLIHIFSPNRYSLASATSYSDVQKASGGSWLVKADMDHTKFDDSEPLLPSLIQNEFGADAQIKTGVFDTLSLLGGYGYTFVKNSFFFTPQVLLGKGLQNRKFTVDGVEISSLTNATKWSALVSLGYNSEDVFLAGYLSIESIEFKTRSLSMASSHEAARITLGRRF